MSGFGSLCACGVREKSGAREGNGDGARRRESAAPKQGRVGSVPSKAPRGRRSMSGEEGACKSRGGQGASKHSLRKAAHKEFRPGQRAANCLGSREGCPSTHTQGSGRERCLCFRARATQVAQKNRIRTQALAQWRERASAGEHLPEPREVRGAERDTRHEAGARAHTKAQSSKQKILRKAA